MQRTIKWLLLCCFLLAGGLSSTAWAASEDECAIWICLPGGFPSGCGGAQSAMKDRLEDLKPPLPAFSSCVVSSGDSGGSNPSSNYVIAAKMPGGGLIKGTTCRVWSNKNGIQRQPDGCVGTARYIDVFDGEGVQMGNRYYLQGGTNQTMWEDSGTDQE